MKDFPVTSLNLPIGKFAGNYYTHGSKSSLILGYPYSVAIVLLSQEGAVSTSTLAKQRY